MKRGLEILGTTDWRSYALYHAGYRQEILGQFETAQKLYLAALERDPSNSAAHVSLGSLFLRSGSPAAVRYGIAELQRATKDGPVIIGDLPYFSGLYELAVGFYSLNDLDSSLRTLKDALTDLENRIADLRKKALPWRLPIKRKPADDDKLADSLLGIWFSLRAMQIGVRIEQDENAIDELNALDLTRASAQFQYNIACTYSVAASRFNDDAARYLGESLSHLEFAFRLERRLSRHAVDDTSLQFVRERQADAFKMLVDRYTPLAPATSIKAAPESVGGSTLASIRRSP